MRQSKVKAKLKNKQPVVGVALHFYDPSVYELTSLFGFDFIWIDLEHHATSVETANNLMRAARVGTSDIMARPAKGEFMRLGRMLESGAQGILYPRCESAAEAREVVKWSKFAPLGARGFDGGNCDMPYCLMEPAEYVQKANDETWIVIQIEDPQALEQADEIAAVEGVDVVMLGPADFSILGGFPGQFNHPRIDEALRKLAAACDRHGKAWGTVAGTPQRVKELLDRGARWTTCGCDLVWVLNGLKQAQTDLAAMGVGPLA
ncbi:MAG: HpcH/HpaI aldolase family protein [Planctomycetales bacterium]